MKNEIYVYLIDLPTKVREMVSPSPDGDYTIYINSRLGYHERVKAYHHAMWHIENCDFEKHDIEKIEHEAHKGVR